MAAVTLTTLRARARQRADMPVAGFIEDSATGIDAFINEGTQKLQELLVKAYGESFIEAVSSFSTVAGTTDYALPTDMLAFYGIDLAISGMKFNLLPYSRTETGLNENQTASGLGTKPRYRLVGMATGVIRLLPAPDAVYAARLRYAPSATLLVNAGDSVNFPNGWERFIVIYAAIQMLAKEESDTRTLQAMLDKMEFELAEIAQRRNADQPHSVVDIESVGQDKPSDYI